VEAEIMGGVGFDWLMIDMEQGFTLISKMHPMQGSEVIPLVRAYWNDFVII
jgi:2-keto-3-deoxy-L-rhamnonate aldolase RhmA